MIDLDGMIVAVQGREASFHVMAAQKHFGTDVTLVHCATFGEVFERLSECDFGVVAVENSISGAVHEVGDAEVSVRELIKDCEARVVGEVSLPIEQCLLTLPGAKVEDVTAVYSHDAALKQCSGFLQNNLPNAKRVEHEDTAGAAADVKRWGNPHFAAIASRAAAELHGLQVRAANIGNASESVTKFYVISNAPVTAKLKSAHNKLRTFSKLS
ncbi:MAG TPA: prephenate dehydratase domain-containing protein [Candidatus Saccharimonadales bacterium]